MISARERLVKLVQNSVKLFFLLECKISCIYCFVMFKVIISIKVVVFVVIII